MPYRGLLDYKYIFSYQYHTNFGDTQLFLGHYISRIYSVLSSRDFRFSYECEEGKKSKGSAILELR